MGQLRRSIWRRAVLAQRVTVKLGYGSLFIGCGRIKSAFDPTLRWIDCSRLGGATTALLHLRAREPPEDRLRYGDGPVRMMVNYRPQPFCCWSAQPHFSGRNNLSCIHRGWLVGSEHYFSLGWVAKSEANEWRRSLTGLTGASAELTARLNTPSTLLLSPTLLPSLIFQATSGPPLSANPWILTSHQESVVPPPAFISLDLFRALPSSSTLLLLLTLPRNALPSRAVDLDH
jgi:hypothetical protein